MPLVHRLPRSDTALRPSVRPTARRAAGVLGGLMLTALLGLGHAQARDMVSVRGEKANLRAGPGTDTEVLWELRRGYPLQVLRRQGGWLQVRDYENDRGWIARSLTGDEPHHVVKVARAQLRRGPGTQHPVAAQVTYGELLRTLGRQGSWVQVEREDGLRGWVAAGLLWGW